MADNELGAFIRSRREAITPAEVGLPGGARRRTPGLRRSELATLAGISVEYLTRLEQGRDRHPSGQVLGALADALRLSMDDRLLLRLAAKTTGGEPCPAATPPTHTVRPTVSALLDHLEPAPAILLNRLSDVLAMTAAYARVMERIGLLDTEPPNFIRFVFGGARARAAYPEWDRVADECIASLRTESSSADPHVAALVDELSVTAGAAFTDRFDAPPRLPERTGVERLAHPDVGELRLSYETLDLAGVDGQRLVVYLAADDATSTVLDHLTGREPGALRAVSG